MFDATHLQNVQPTATIKVAEIQTSKRQSPKRLQAQRSRSRSAKSSLPFEIGICLRFGSWSLDFSRAVIRSAALDCSYKLQWAATPLRSVLLGSLSSIG
jgi:hypothetical protein